MTTKIILLNAAPSAGKDTLANYLEKSGEFIHWKYANKVREVAHVFYPQVAWWDDIAKDLPHKELKGKTPRQILIKIGLSMRAEIDKDIWVTALANEIDEYQAGLGIDNTFVISDCGFQNEVDVMVERFGRENVLLVTIFREYCGFENDSRDYVGGDCEKRVLWNVDKTGFLNEGVRLIKEWLDEPPKTKMELWKTIDSLF